MPIADDGPNFSNFLKKKIEIQIFIAIFGLSMENPYKWGGESLVLDGCSGSWDSPLNFEKIVPNYTQICSLPVKH